MNTSLPNPSITPRRLGRRALELIPRLNLGEEEEEDRTTWRWLLNRDVDPKYLPYNPDDMAEIDDLDTLFELREFYYPPSKPRNIYDHGYCVLMITAIDDRLYTM